MVLAPRIHAVLGFDRSHYKHAAEVQCFTGTAPVIERSGKAYWVHSRMACPRFLRQTFHEFAAYPRFSSPWAHAYYDQMRLRNVAHHAAARALAFKRIRILFRCWKNCTAYDESLYTQTLQRRGPWPWRSPDRPGEKFSDECLEWQTDGTHEAPIVLSPASCVTKNGPILAMRP
jgi:transposase IS116/IS110/IS902 family protein